MPQVINLRELEIEYEKFVEHIRKLLSEGKMSVMVGAGFSKNANKKYPSWDELLFKMVKELYPESISKKSQKKKWEDIQKVIKKVGYLEIVDEYQKKHGYRECVDCYIEDFFIPLNGKKRELDIHKKLIECRWNNVYTTNYDTLIEDANDEIDSAYKYLKVLTSEHLSTGPDRRIIKLHGSIREKEKRVQKEFGFDGCKKHQYIISKEDYDTYSERHEPFMQLMRIALLQESFCLIGFSASDPNFLSWVRWVRDVLEKKWINKNRDPKKPESYNIFLIDVFNETSVEARIQHFFNLGIIIIPLKIIYQNISNSKKLINKFFEEINPEGTETVVLADRNKINGYESLWSKTLQHLNLTALIDVFDEIRKQKKDFRLPPKGIIDFYASQIVPVFINNIKKGPEKPVSELLDLFDFLSIAVEQSFVPYILYEDAFDIIGDFEKIDVSVLSKAEIEKWSNFALIYLKSCRFLGDKDEFEKWKKIILEKNVNVKNEVLYQKCLMSAMLFECEALENILKEWILDENTEPFWLIRKAYLYSLIENEDEAAFCINTLRNKIYTIESKQEKLFCLEMLNYYEFSKTYSRDTSRDYDIGVLKSQGYNTISSFFEFLQPQEKKKNIKPLGYGAYKTSRSVIHGRTDDDAALFNAIRITEILLEMGCPVKLKNTVMIDEKSWFSIHQILCEQDFSLQVAFHSFQYGSNDADEKTVTRFAQQIVLSERIQSELKKELCEKMWISFIYMLLKKDKYLRKHIFILSEFAKVVDYEIWGKHFERFWQHQKETQKTRNYFFKPVWGIKSPIENILKFIDNIELLKDIVSYFLFFPYEVSDFEENLAEYMGNEKNGDIKQTLGLHQLTADYIFFLRQNNKFGELKKVFEDFLNKILSKQLNYWEFAKIYYVLDKVGDVKSAYKSKIVSLLKDYIEKTGIENWQHNLFMELSFGDEEILEKIKCKILEGDFYPTDIKNGRIYYIGRMIPISNFLKTDSVDFGLSFNSEEREKILNKINKNIEEIEEFNKVNKLEVYENSRLLFEMRSFIDSTKSGNETEEAFLNKIDALMLKSYKIRNYEEGLFSNDDNTFVVSLENLINDLNKHCYVNILNSWDILIFKAISQSSVRLEMTLDLISHTLAKCSSEEFFDEKRLKYYDILLCKYYERMPEDVDNINITKSMLRIVFKLKERGFDFPIISKWIERKDKSQFYEIRKISGK